MTDWEKTDLSPEEQKLLEELSTNRYDPNELPKDTTLVDNRHGVQWEGVGPSRPHEFDKEKFREFYTLILKMMGADIFGPALDNLIDAITNYFSGATPPKEPPFAEVNPVSMADFILVWEANTGKVFKDLPPATQDMILQSYDIFMFQDELVVELVDKVNTEADVLKNIYSKTGEIPGEEFAHIDDAVIGAAITGTYSTEADLAYKSFLTKQQHEAQYKTNAAMAIDNRSATDFENQLAAGDITLEQYLEGMDNIILASDLDVSPDELLDMVDNPQKFLLPAGEYDPWLQSRIADPSQFGFIGIEEYDQEIYSSKEQGSMIPLYETGVDRLLFANASPEEIAEVQNLLVESGFLQPYSFAYGVIDFNQPDGGTLAAINSAMSRFNLNADTISKEDLYSILLAPGADSSNLIVFVKEFFKDTLEDYGYGTNKFEPHSTVGYSQGYQELFQYQSPNMINSHSDIQFALERGLGRPVSSQEINSFVDYYSQIAYDLQKRNFDIRQENIQTQLLGEEQRYQAYLQGKTDFELPELQQQIDLDSAMATSMSNYVRQQYGEAITGEDKTRAMQETLLNLLNTIGSLSQYTSGGRG